MFRQLRVVEGEGGVAGGANELPESLERAVIRVTGINLDMFRGSYIIPK